MPLYAMHNLIKNLLVLRMDLVGIVFRTMNTD